MSEVTNYALQSRDALRRMRRAILEGDDKTAEQGLNHANDLARAVGQLMLANVLGQDTTSQRQAVDGLLNVYEPIYAGHEPVFSSNSMIHGLNEFASQLHNGLQGNGDFMFNPAGGRLWSRDEFVNAYNEGSRHWFYAPLATDILYAHVMDQLIRHHLGFGFDIIPAASDKHKLHAVLPTNAPIELQKYCGDPMPYIYQDQEGGGQTWNAVEAAVKERLAAQAEKP